MKKLLSIALSLCLLLSVALADVTLTKVYKTEDLVSNTFHNGFVTAIGMTGENTVVLKDDGTYEYTKRLMQTAEDGTVAADLVYTFTGTYTKDGDTVVLMFPTAGTASENWGPLAGSYFQNTENASFADSDYGLLFDVYMPAGDSAQGPHPTILCGDGCWQRVTAEYVELVTGRGYALCVFDRTTTVPDFMFRGDRSEGAPFVPVISQNAEGISGNVFVAGVLRRKN